MVSARVRRRRAMMLIGAGLLLCLAEWLMFRPGIAEYDTVNQYHQVLTGHYDDWHPPAMARLWSLFAAMGLGGTGPMFALQLGLFWGGLTLIASAVARIGAPRAGGLVLAIGLFPIVPNAMIVVLKDSQLIAAMTGAVGLVAWFRLRRRPIPGWAVAAVALLLGYAVLVRANSVFAIVPLAWSLAGWGGVRRWWARAGLVVAGVAMVILVSGPINHRLLGAEPSHVENTLPIFDIAGIAHYAHLDSVPGVSAEDWAVVATRDCYTPFYWDRFGDYKLCGAVGDALADPAVQPSLFRRWVVMIVSHPVAYAEHRLAHLNANLRFLVPADEKSAAGMPKSDANAPGLGSAGNPATRALFDATIALARTPLGSPFAWLVALAGLGWALLGTHRQPARELGLALALSAGCMTASFAMVSIASDLRYHLWLIVATLLTGAMAAACERVPVGRITFALALWLAICAVEIAARMVLVSLPM